ncbi:hypothetical protein F2Q69_00025405 [Brassica cretica]|uniref:Uncharacterized protein n=1 Tax=Brassica cretica TaxID=69181 RepID=A0A8S9QAD5_BRACR|nr:hypothetical protein F2Q69_00025405 [Brassica cretica]
MHLEKKDCKHRCGGGGGLKERTAEKMPFLSKDPPSPKATRAATRPTLPERHKKPLKMKMFCGFLGVLASHPSSLKLGVLWRFPLSSETRPVSGLTTAWWCFWQVVVPLVTGSAYDFLKKLLFGSQTRRKAWLWLWLYRVITGRHFVPTVTLCGDLAHPSAVGCSWSPQECLLCLHLGLRSFFTGVCVLRSKRLLRVAFALNKCSVWSKRVCLASAVAV